MVGGPSSGVQAPSEATIPGPRRQEPCRRVHRGDAGCRCCSPTPRRSTVRIPAGQPERCRWPPRCSTVRCCSRMSFLTGPRLLRDPADCPPALGSRTASLRYQPDAGRVRHARAARSTSANRRNQQHRAVGGTGVMCSSDAVRAVCGSARACVLEPRSTCDASTPIHTCRCTPCCRLHSGVVVHGERCEIRDADAPIRGNSATGTGMRGSRIRTRRERRVRPGENRRNSQVGRPARTPLS